MGLGADTEVKVCGILSTITSASNTQVKFLAPTLVTAYIAAVFDITKSYEKVSHLPDTVITTSFNAASGLTLNDQLFDDYFHHSNKNCWI